MNNLYGHGLKKKLPSGEFHWVDNEHLNGLINTILHGSDEDEIGWFIEVDLKYPNHLHRKHNAFPLAPTNEKVIIHGNNFSFFYF